MRRTQLWDRQGRVREEEKEAWRRSLNWESAGIGKTFGVQREVTGGAVWEEQFRGAGAVIRDKRLNLSA